MSSQNPLRTALAGLLQTRTPVPGRGASGSQQEGSSDCTQGLSVLLCLVASHWPEFTRVTEGAPDSDRITEGPQGSLVGLTERLFFSFIGPCLQHIMTRSSWGLGTRLKHSLFLIPLSSLPSPLFHSLPFAKGLSHSFLLSVFDFALDLYFGFIM